MLNKLSFLISTFFYTGRVGFAPGTIASLLTLILWILFVPDDYLVRFIIILLLFLIGIASTMRALTILNEKDPQEIVIDEVIGMSISLFLITDISLMIVAFCLFRIFDIFKPSIIYYSQDYDGAYGVIFDDVFAGICVLIILIGYV